MKFNIKSEKNICKNPYKHHYFWEHKILRNDNLWEGYFENECITKKSRIIYTGILDNEKDIVHFGFAVYPSVYKLLGFLEHVFLPTAFFTWFDRKSLDFYIPLSPYPTVVSEVLEYTKDIDLNMINSINNSYDFLNNLWLFDEKLLNIALKSFYEKFNNEWDKDFDQKIFLKIFDSPSDVFDFVKNSIGWSDCDEFIAEELSMSLDTLKFTCNNVLTEPLLNKKFIDILNTHMPILF
ncbi:hypothetical protein [Clostridium saccharoperbutylacetonicum]|uniref:hypothetical protein n=1 Tax=Clostridium saccharoperbutylacetonicum TaxID=36745 RepID=UPI0039E9FD85